jgi:phospholipase C
LHRCTSLLTQALCSDATPKFESSFLLFEMAFIKIPNCVVPLVAFCALLFMSGCAGLSKATTTPTTTPSNPGTTTGPAPTVTISATPTTINQGQASTLTVAATNATQVVISNNVDSTTVTLPGTGGTTTVKPNQGSITYTATATGNGQTATATVTLTVGPPGSIQSVQHVIFLLHENRTFDSYFGMLNPYRQANNLQTGDDGKVYTVDGIDDKLNTISNVNDQGQTFKLFHTTSTCLDDMSSAWLESYGDVNRYNFNLNRPILMDGFVHTAEGYANSCSQNPGGCAGTFTDFAGERAMAYYQDVDATGSSPELNYYYFMASQFALSDRWFSPVSSKSTPNRIATYTGGTTQGLVYDPFTDDIPANPNITTLNANTIFQELDQASVPWKIYYSETQDGCLTDGSPCATPGNKMPDTTFSAFSWSGKYLYSNTAHAACTGTTKPGDAANTFCIDPTRIAPISQYLTDVQNGTLPAFAYIEPAYGASDEHPGSGQSILVGQQQAANLINALMQSPSWQSSIFFLSYDEAGGPYDHVPPVTGHSNDFTTDPNKATDYPDIGGIAVNPDTYNPCSAVNPTTGQWMPTQHCDLKTGDPGMNPSDAPAQLGFKAQLGFRLPNMIVSPFTRKHYVGHSPMDHTAILKFVESRFLPGSTHLTPRVAAQPDLLDFFDFTNVPWAVPPTGIPTPAPVGQTCHPTMMH